MISGNAERVLQRIQLDITGYFFFAYCWCFCFQVFLCFTLKKTHYWEEEKRKKTSSQTKIICIPTMWKFNLMECSQWTRHAQYIHLSISYCNVEAENSTEIMNTFQVSAYHSRIWLRLVQCYRCNIFFLTLLRLFRHFFLSFESTLVLFIWNHRLCYHNYKYLIQILSKLPMTLKSEVSTWKKKVPKPKFGS